MNIFADTFIYKHIKDEVFKVDPSILRGYNHQFVSDMFDCLFGSLIFLFEKTKLQSHRQHAENYFY